ncbi:MAG: hypothetical protein J07HX64_02971 [halophilic archaeon J07HX64]|nr:MAG: hypothetical protein J07HX64_02971 [halophilic archaeon J07HX64]
MLVVATADFEVYHDIVTDLRERDVPFTTLEPGAEFPPGTEVVVRAVGETVQTPTDAAVVEATPGDPRTAVEEAVTALRGANGHTIVGIDPGERPGIAVLKGDVVVSTFQVAPEEVAEVVHRETADVSDPLVRIGDGARLVGARIVDELDVPVELVDETGTTPYLGTGTRGVGDVIAAINIARIEGERVESRDVDPTAGELQHIQNRSREAGQSNREIDADLARQVATGDLTMGEALEKHRG